jgi:hypothetical protein
MSKVESVPDLTTGPVVSTTDLPKVKQHPTREPELYKGEPPQNDDGKTRIEWVLASEKCKVKDWDRKNKEFTCSQKLHVVRVKNQIFEKDESGAGGQLNYDDHDVRQYLICPIHGGLPKPKVNSNGFEERFDRWEPGSKL